MKMLKQDWYDYSNYLRSQVNTSELQTPSSLSVAFNNFQIMQDLENVMEEKLGVASKKTQARYVKGQA